MHGVTRCRMHGGTRQRKAGTGDPALGGAPVQTGVYAKYLRGAYATDHAAARTGGLDEEIRVAKAYLAGAIRNHQADPKGGVHVSAGPVTKVRLHADVVADLLDRIRKLELARAELLAGPAPTDDNAMQDYRSWIAAQAAPASAAPSTEPSSPSPSGSSSPEPSGCAPCSPTPAGISASPPKEPSA